MDKLQQESEFEWPQIENSEKNTYVKKIEKLYIIDILYCLLQVITSVLQET